MKTIHQFITKHPRTACFISAAISFILTAETIFRLTGEPPLYHDPWIVVAYGVIAGAIIAGILFFKKTVVVIMAAALLSCQVARSQEKLPAIVVVGLVVAVGAGVAIVGCKVIKKCNKIAAGKTNLPPEELNFFIAGQPVTYAAAFTEGEEGYCLAERLLEPVAPVRFTLNITIAETNAVVTMSADVGHEFVQSLAQCREESAAIGLDLASGIGRTESYSRNRQPVFAEQVPISFDWSTRTVTLGGGGIIVTVEASDDLRVWATLVKFNADTGSELELQDVSTEKQFYRVKLGNQ